MKPSWARAAKNASILIVLKFLMPVLSLGLVFVVSRQLGAEGLGRYTLVLAYFYFFIMLTPLGLDALLTREGARNPDVMPALLGNAAVMALASSLIAMATMIALSLSMDYDPITRSALRLSSLAIFPSTLLSLFEAVFVARERFKLIAASSLVELTVKVGGSVPLLLLGYGVQAVVLMVVLSRLAACCLSWGLLSRVGMTLRFGVDKLVWQQLLRAVPTFLSISVFSTLYWRIDTLMLSMFRDLTDVAYYGAAYRLMELVKILPQSLCRALYPQISQSVRSEPERLNELGSLALRYLWVALLPLALVMTIFAEPILAMLYGDALRPAAISLTVLIWTVLPYACARYYAYLLIASDRQQIDLRLNVLMTVVNVGLNLILMPRYGPLGAALATCLSIGLYALGQYYYIHVYQPHHAAAFPEFGKPLVAALVMALCGWWGRSFHFVPMIAALLIVYATVLLLSRYFAPDELRFLRLVRLWARVSSSR